MSGFFADLTSREIAAMDTSRLVCVLPLGAIEQHGPHLPLATDAIIADGIVRELLRNTCAADSVLVLPQLSIGHSPEHTGFAGTLSVRAEVLLQHWEEVARSVARSGIDRLVLLNTHGGQNVIVDLAAVRLRNDSGMLVVRVNLPRLGMPEGVFDTDEIAMGIHGGEIETSLLLHLAPNLVRKEYLANFEIDSDVYPFSESKHIGIGRVAGFGWRSEDLNPQGVLGNAAKADADRGRRYIEFLGKRLYEICVELASATPLKD